MKPCDACGNPKGSIVIGGAILCRSCEPAIREEIDHLRAGGKAVNTLHIARRIYKETYSGGDYLLRDVPKDLWEQAKHRAIDEGFSLRDLILKSLFSYLK